MLTAIHKKRGIDMNTKIKTLLINILTKLPIFLFCVLFINIHNKVFGEVNSIVGVVLLIGLFMFMRGDLGFNAKQASISIVFLFILVAVAPKLSIINPFLGIIINAISIFIIMVMSSHNVTMSNHVTFMMGYLFCQGYDVSGKDYGLRVISLLVGAVIIALIYYMVNRKKSIKEILVIYLKKLILIQ